MDRTFADIVKLIINLIGTVIPVLFIFALLVFFWGVARVIWNTGNEQALEEGKTWMLYAVITMFVLFSVWGLIQLVLNFFGADALI